MGGDLLEEIRYGQQTKFVLVAFGQREVEISAAAAALISKLIIAQRILIRQESIIAKILILRSNKLTLMINISGLLLLITIGDRVLERKCKFRTGNKNRQNCQQRSGFRRHFLFASPNFEVQE